MWTCDSVTSKILSLVRPTLTIILVCGYLQYTPLKLTRKYYLRSGKDKTDTGTTEPKKRSGYLAGHRPHNHCAIWLFGQLAGLVLGSAEPVPQTALVHVEVKISSEFLQMITSRTSTSDSACFTMIRNLSW